MFQMQMTNLESSMNLILAIDNSVLLQLSAEELAGPSEEDEVEEDDR